MLRDPLALQVARLADAPAAVSRAHCLPFNGMTAAAPDLVPYVAQAVAQAVSHSGFARRTATTICKKKGT
ncbi:hypothetical protein [Paraburkholderia kururiensis]|uniref:hypothetical protein n=1 Tax=Paraburkholderia kururiensis TaxID=984307 RepID=UPI00034D4CC8|nr:hypothetical protein [Paraburkholderia kururiensis]